MHLAYLQKSREHAQLKQQMSQVFRQTMPPGTTVVDVPLQLQSHLNELQQQVQLFGFSGQGAATVLQTLSSQISPELTVDLQEFNYSNDTIRLVGNTDSFETVNQIAEQLGRNRTFSQVEITDAKLATDSSQIDFELQLQLVGGSE